MAIFGHFPQNSLKVGISPGRPPRRGLFYINPSRRGPVPGPGSGRPIPASHVAETLQAAAALERGSNGKEGKL